MTPPKKRNTADAQGKTTLGMQYGVGAHEPIYHRLRTGNSTAEEWARWEQETSTENLDLLQSLV